jgi:hypothetical protein
MAVEAQNVFEERAERLSKDELQAWTRLSSNDVGIIRKLKGPGVKLLVGPRGSGKSTLFRIALYEMLEAGDALPIYVNFSHSLALEPLFFSHANALKLFRQWLLQKVVVGLAETYELLGQLPTPAVATRIEIGRRFIQDLERGHVGESSDFFLAPSELVELLEQQAQAIGRFRSVLLLDDAAHAFSHEQQREFFEVFRQLRSRRVSPKAAVYPGITNYSHSFNVAHEAEPLVVWYQPIGQDYLNAMRDIAKRRLPQEVLDRFGGASSDYLDILALAAFGHPRGFINMLSQVNDALANAKGISRSLLLKAIDDHAQYVRGVFRSLSNKLPRYKLFIDYGQKIERAIVKGMTAHNRLKSLEAKATMVGIGDPLPQKLDRIMKFMEYAGMVRPQADHSRGDKGIYKRYSVHNAILISEGALGLGQSYKNADIVSALVNPDAHAYYRVTASSLVSTDFETNCILDLPPCSVCSAQRISEDQKFCANCGSKLAEASIYRELLQKPITELPLPKAKIQGILEHTQLRTVQDILTDHDQRVKDVPYIDKAWTRRIRNVAEEFVSV